MDSDSDGVLVEDSDDSMLDIKELDDAEYNIPAIVAPSLESVLWDLESASQHSDDAISEKSNQSGSSTTIKSILYHSVLRGISAQIKSAGDKVDAGLPTVIANSQSFVSVGTSHGYLLTFDAEQKLCWFCHDVVTLDQGAISALAFNCLSTRLLVGYERGYISQLDTVTGDVIRRLPDAHGPHTAVLLLRYTAVTNFALVGDSSGSVFSLTFHRRLDRRRTGTAKCLFSGARGEVCTFEPLIQQGEGEVVVAMGTLSKIIVITVKPKLRVLYSQQLPRCATSLPLLSWQLVLVGKSWQPVLCWGRGSEVNYTRLVVRTGMNKMYLVPLRKVTLPYTVSSLHWIGASHLAMLDTTETLHLVDVRTQTELENLDLTSVGLVYASAHFKALAVGGGVSQAFSLAGELACYNTLASRGDQLLLLGSGEVHLVKLRTCHDRLVYLSRLGRWTEALRIAASNASVVKSAGSDKLSAARGCGNLPNASANNLLERYVTSLGDHSSVDWSAVTAAVGCCIKLNRCDFLYNQIWESVSTDKCNQNWYLSLLVTHICSGTLTELSPALAQVLIAYLDDAQHNHEPQQDNPENDSTARHKLHTVLLTLELHCLDLDQVLRICRAQRFYDAWIHITTKTMRDYASPLVEFLPELTPDNHSLGNTMLVYVSACLAGYGYPHGAIPSADVSRVKYDVLRCLESMHSVTAPHDEPAYPYLSALLLYNTRECLNVIKLAFTEQAEFAGEMGLLQRQRLVEILMQIIVPPKFQDSQIISLVSFISRLITTSNLTLTKTMLDVVTKRLTNLAGKPLNNRDHCEREEAWLDLLASKNLQHVPSGQLLTNALESKCYKVAEYLYEIAGDYAKIIYCYLNDPFRRRDVFSYIKLHINSHIRCIQEQFCEHFIELLSINSSQCMDLVIEHYNDKLYQYERLVEKDDDSKYLFLKYLVYNYDKVTSTQAEDYLELICQRSSTPSSSDEITHFIRLQLCRHDQALAITQRYHHTFSTAHLLETTGDYNAALELLITDNRISEALACCIRGTEHLDNGNTMTLWLRLLRHCRNSNSVLTTSVTTSDNSGLIVAKNSVAASDCNGITSGTTTGVKSSDSVITLRDLVHNAGPHVPPMQLLELVNDAQMGDVRDILVGVFTDYKYDLLMLRTTLKLLSRDLHHNLAQHIYNGVRGVSLVTLLCDMCQRSFNSLEKYNTVSVTSDRDSVVLFGCGHCYHGTCHTTLDRCGCCLRCNVPSQLCVVVTTQAQCKRLPVVSNGGIRENGKAATTVRLRERRPDLEGHF